MFHPEAMVSIVDFGMGNLFSVQQACMGAGLYAKVTTSRLEIEQSDAIILPGVGAFGNAITTLDSLDLINPLIDFAKTGKPMLGICLGMQLMMTESNEFGRHKGLGLIDGAVERLIPSVVGERSFKVPHIGWNKINSDPKVEKTCPNGCCRSKWDTEYLRGVDEGEYMYFVHSYYVQPDDRKLLVSKTTYGEMEFCSSLARDNIFACQFHPERSGQPGLEIYKNLARLLDESN